MALVRVLSLTVIARILLQFLFHCFLDLLHLSRNQRSSFRSQDSYPSCSSPTNSLQSTDSLDQFCKDFESSCNLTSQVSLNSGTLQLCDNKAESELGDEKLDDKILQLTSTVQKTDQGSFDEAPSYEGQSLILLCEF